jgi:peptide/nickel transport system substrate-binding protein
VAQLIQSQWRDLGIELDLIQVPDYPTLLEYVEKDEYHLIAFTDFGVDASILNRFYLSDGSGNWSHLNDPEVDNWLLEGMRQSDPATRAPLYGSVQQRVMEQAAVLPIRDYVNLNGTSARLDGVIFSAQGWWPLLRNLQLTS